MCHMKTYDIWGSAKISYGWKVILVTLCSHNFFFYVNVVQILCHKVESARTPVRVWKQVYVLYANSFTYLYWRVNSWNSCSCLINASYFFSIVVVLNLWNINLKVNKLLWLNTRRHTIAQIMCFERKISCMCGILTPAQQSSITQSSGRGLNPGNP